MIDNKDERLVLNRTYVCYNEVRKGGDLMAELNGITIDENLLKRKIIHVDMDAFYASIEEREHPEFIGKPLVIAHDPRKNGGRGVVATANYEARKLGIHSAMAAQEAYEICPKAIFKAPDFTLYKEVSSQLHEIFHEYTEMIEPIAFDEAYLDVTQNKKEIKSAIQVAHMIQREIYQKLHLTCSTGVSYNKFLAKLASDYNKPAGMTLILPGDVIPFLSSLPIGKFRGVGKKTAPKMIDQGIFTGKELLEKSEVELIQQFGKLGYFLYKRVRGVDDRPVEWQRERKSIGSERTYGKLLMTIDEVETQLRYIASLVSETLNKQQKHGKTLVIKVRYQDFTTLTKRLTLDEFIRNDAATIYFYGRQIFDEILGAEKGIRLLGLTMTNLAPIGFENMKLPLFEKKVLNQPL